MDKRIERLLIFAFDFLTINLALLIYFYLRVETGWFELISKPAIYFAMFGLYLYWTVLFFFVGMYRTWFASSRFDEISLLFKTSFVGIFFLFAAILYDDSIHNAASSNRILIFYYWGIFVILTSSGRLLVRGLQRSLLIKGVGRRNALLIGFNPVAFKIHKSIIKYRALGIDVFGYVAVKNENVGKQYNGVNVLGQTNEISAIMEKNKITNIIIALEKHENDVVMEVISECTGKDVSIQIVPDLYYLISGQARTSQIYGFPLIDIMPELMPEWEKKAKRLLDIVVSFLILIVSLPVILITAIAIKIESKGPIFYKQERIGYKGRPFKVIKFRSMVVDAEEKSGPVWSTKNDPRITKVGNIIRKIRVDEIPQLFNVFYGEMSLVGPRPERQHFIEQLSKEIPLYKRRLRVRPGITGWAQVKHKYDETVEDVKTKLNYDLFYIENISLRMDLKILFRTIFVVLFGKGQ